MSEKLCNFSFYTKTYSALCVKWIGELFKQLHLQFKGCYLYAALQSIVVYLVEL